MRGAPTLNAAGVHDVIPRHNTVEDIGGGLRQERLGGRITLRFPSGSTAGINTANGTTSTISHDVLEAQHGLARLSTGHILVDRLQQRRGGVGVQVRELVKDLVLSLVLPALRVRQDHRHRIVAPLVMGALHRVHRGLRQHIVGVEGRRRAATSGDAHRDLFTPVVCHPQTRLPEEVDNRILFEEVILDFRTDRSAGGTPTGVPYF